jgi:hypothetical protein
MPDHLQREMIFPFFFSFLFASHWANNSCWFYL